MEITKISIIIPTIGRKTLNEVLASILGADLYNEKLIEVIVVADGDLKKEDILGIGNKFKSIKYLSTGENVGASMARNLGIEKSTGEIISFIGDDTIIDKNWINENIKFHTKNPQINRAMLGQINWIDEFKDDPFYKWLNNWAQFSYRKIKLHGAKWNNFYTSNVSLKKELLSNDRFFAGFTGWGFEDSELGYRLYKKGMNLIYNSDAIVYHDHEQTIDDVCKNFRNARQNAQIFEKLHPELRIIPKGKKLEALKIMIKITKFLSPLIPEAKWWYKWKESWIQED